MKINFTKLLNADARVKRLNVPINERDITDAW